MTANCSVDTNQVMPLPEATAARLEVRFGGFSCAGAKAENQDAFAAHQPAPSVRHLKGAVACIADGVSSSENASQASQISVTHFIEDYFSTPDTWPVKTAAARVLSALNNWLYHHGLQSHAPHNGLVTTFSALVIKSTTAHIFHAGDSRIHRFRNGDLEPLTQDHNHLQAGDKVFLTRALGMDNHLEMDYLQEDVSAGDLFVLTTDGVHESLPIARLRELLNDVEDDLEASARRIAEAAAEAGSQDNLSCLLVRIDHLPLEAIDEAHRKLTRLAIPPALEVGMKLDGFEVQEVLHSGTRSHLYRVTHPQWSQPLVLKAPSENFAEDPQYLEGFIREQWVGRRVNHRGVMKIHPHDADSPFLYHLCEYIEGQTLRQWMYDHPSPGLDDVRPILKTLVSSLRAFQRLGMVHRDLKPENVMIDKSGRVIIIDFGTVQVSGLEEIASPLREECPVGSVNYIAPEYLMGERGVHRSDIFSLGVIIYEMLAGAPPFKPPLVQRQVPKSYDQWQYRSLCDQRRDIPAWVDLALKKATAPRPSQRYPALSEFLQDVMTPNPELLRKLEAAPLIERHPLRFWQLISGALLLLVVIQWAMLAGML